MPDLFGHLFRYRFIICVRFVGIEHLVAVHHGHKVLGFREIYDVVRVARKHVHGLDVVAIDLPFQHLAGRVIKVARGP